MKNLLSFLYDEFQNMTFNHKAKFYIGIIILILGCSISGIVQIIFKNFLKILASHTDLVLFYILGISILYSIAWTCNQVTNIVVWLLTQKSIVEFAKKVVIKSFAHILAIPYELFIIDTNKTIPMYLENIFTALQIILSNIIIHILPAMIEMIITFFFFYFLYGIAYSILLLILIILFFSLIYYSIYKNKSIENNYYEQYDIFKEHINHVLLHIEIIKLYNANKYECKNLYTILKSFFDISHKRNLILDYTQVYHIIACGTILFLLTILSYYQYTQKIISIADIVFINNYFLQFSIPMTFLGYIFSDLYKNIILLEQAYKIFSFPQDIKKIFQSAGNHTAIDIQCHNVTYTCHTQTILHNISITILEGKKIALVGPSGSGKSTLLKILCGLLRNINGTITIQNISLDSMPVTQISTFFTLIPQQSYLFLGTIKENILYNLEDDIPEKEIITVLEKLLLYEKINSLKDGLNTDIQKIDFSGGEKQRIAIARGILRKTPIFLLDEITASLDFDSEKNVISYLEEILIKKTVITVTHRIQMMERFDLIIVMEKGSIIAQGSHEELIKNNTLYQSLYNKTK